MAERFARRKLMKIQGESRTDRQLRHRVTKPTNSGKTIAGEI
jgi:hypothetical protein